MENTIATKLNDNQIIFTFHDWKENKDQFIIIKQTKNSTQYVINKLNKFEQIFFLTRYSS